MKKLYALLMILILSSCAITPKPPSGEHYLTWSARQQQLSSIQSWNLQGTASIKNTNQSVVTHVNWQQSNNDFILNVTSQLNIGGIKITGNNDQVTLWRSSTNKITAKTPEKLMYQELGWSLPISNLRYWVLGLPAPKSDYKTQFDTFNHLAYLQQQGWQITYANFVAINGIDLPSTILLKNTNLQIKIVIKEWQLGKSL